MRKSLSFDDELSLGSDGSMSHRSRLISDVDSSSLLNAPDYYHMEVFCEEDEPLMQVKDVSATVLKPKAQCTLLLPRILAQLIYDEPAQLLNSFTRHFSAALLVVHFSRVDDNDLASRDCADFLQKVHAVALAQGGDIILCTSCFMQVIWCGHDTSEDTGHVVCRAAQCAIAILKATEAASMKISFIVSVGSLSQVQSGGESGKYVWSLAGIATLAAQRCVPLLLQGAVIITPEAWACIAQKGITSEPAGNFGAHLLLDHQHFPKISIPLSINRIIRPAAQDMLPEWPDRKLALVGMYMCAPLTSKLQEPLLLNIFDGAKRTVTCVIVCLSDIAADFSRAQESLFFSPANTTPSHNFPKNSPSKSSSNLNVSGDSSSTNTSFDGENFAPSPPPIDTIDRQAVRSFHSDVNATILHLQRTCAGKSGRLLWAAHDTGLPGLAVCCVFGLDAPVLNSMSIASHDAGSSYTQALDFVKLLQLRRSAAVGVASSPCYPIIFGDAAAGRLTSVVLGNCVSDAILCCDAAMALPAPDAMFVPTSPTQRPRVSRVVADEFTAQKWSSFRRVKTSELCDVSLNLLFHTPPSNMFQAFVFQKVESDAVVSLGSMSTMLTVNTFVGRDEETSKLRSILHDFMYNSVGGVVCVQGEAGYGKSALIDHIFSSSSSVLPSGIQLMKIKCRPSVMHGPLQVWKEVLFRFPAYASLESWSSFCAYLKANCPEFTKVQQHARLLAPSDGDVASSNMAALRTEQQHGIMVLVPLILRAFTTGLQQYRLANRFVFVFEDVQTQSPLFWQVLRALSAEHLSWLFVLTHRTQPTIPSGNPDVPNLFNYHKLNADKEMIILPSKYTSLTLQPFSQRETGMLVKSMLSADSVVESIVDAIFVVTQGSPRCISEVIEVLHRRGVLLVVASCVTTVGSGRVEVDIAHAVADAATTSPMELALKQVRGYERLVLRIAAVAHVPLSDEMFFKLLNLGTLEIRHALDKLTNVLGVFEKHSGNKYAFKHEVYRHWITHRMKAFEIHELHLKCAMVWESLGMGVENPLVLAYHYEHCGSSTISIQYYESCAERAFESHDYAVAVSMYTELIRLASAQRNFDGHLMFQYRLNCGKSYLYLGQMAVAASELEAAADLVKYDIPRTATVNRLATVLSLIIRRVKYSSTFLRFCARLSRGSHSALAPNLAWELLTALYQAYLWRNQSRMALACCAHAACLDVSDELRAVSLAQTALTCSVDTSLSWMGRRLENTSRAILSSLEHPAQEAEYQICLALGLRSSVFCRWHIADEDLRRAQKAASYIGSDVHICTTGLFLAQNALWRADLASANSELKEIQDKGAISSLSQNMSLYCFYQCLRIMIDHLFVRNYYEVKHQCDEILQHINDIHSLDFLLIYPLLALAECKIGNWHTADVYCGEIVERFHVYSDAPPWMVHWMPLFIGRTILETECRGTCMNSGTCFPPHHWHSCCHNASILRSRNAAAGTLFSGQPHRHVLPDRLYSRFEKLLKNTDSYPITRAQRSHVMGLQHLADGNQKKAVKSLSKAIYFCQVNGLKWELVRAADDLQQADAAAVTPDELSAIQTIPLDFRECPGSRPLILRIEAQFWMLKYVTSKAFKAIRAMVAIVAFILSMLACLYAVL